MRGLWCSSRNMPASSKVKNSGRNGTYNLRTQYHTTTYNSGMDKYRVFQILLPVVVITSATRAANLQDYQSQQSNFTQKYFDLLAEFCCTTVYLHRLNHFSSFRILTAASFQQGGSMKKLEGCLKVKFCTLKI